MGDKWECEMAERGERILQASAQHPGAEDPSQMPLRGRKKK